MVFPIPSASSVRLALVGALLCGFGFLGGLVAAPHPAPVAPSPMAMCKPSPALEAAHARHVEVLRLQQGLQGLSCLVELAQQQKVCNAAIASAVRQVSGARRIGGL